MTTDIDSSSEPFVAPKTFGASFREAREQAGFSIERAAMSTRISAGFIEALENHNFKILPGDIFGRGFVRNLCRAYGCDSKALVIAYDQAVAGQLIETNQEPVRDNKPKNFRLNEDRRPSFDSGNFQRSASKAWNFARPVAIAVPVLLGILWLSQTAYQSWKSSDKDEPIAETAAVAPAPVVTPVVETPAPVVAAPVVAEVPAVVRGAGIESLDLVVKSPVQVRIGRDKDKQVIETLQPNTYRFQFDEQLRLLVDDMSSVDLKFKGQLVPNKGVKGEKRYMTFAVSEGTLAKKNEKPKL